MDKITKSQNHYLVYLWKRSLLVVQQNQKHLNILGIILYCQTTILTSLISVTFMQVQEMIQV